METSAILSAHVITITISLLSFHGYHLFACLSSPRFLFIYNNHAFSVADRFRRPLLGLLHVLVYINAKPACRVKTC